MDTIHLPDFCDVRDVYIHIHVEIYNQYVHLEIRIRTWYDPHVFFFFTSFFFRVRYSIYMLFFHLFQYERTQPIGKNRTPPLEYFLPPEERTNGTTPSRLGRYVEGTDGEWHHRSEHHTHTGLQNTTDFRRKIVPYLSRCRYFYLIFFFLIPCFRFI